MSTSEQVVSTEYSSEYMSIVDFHSSKVQYNTRGEGGGRSLQTAPQTVVDRSSWPLDMPYCIILYVINNRNI